jgi:hypothetical protein
MASSLYNSRGNWTSSVRYNYLDAVQSGTYTYICTELSGSLGQLPSSYPLIWVQIPVITQEDQYYLRSREDLLQYEDARFQSLINAMANCYTTRNDQSIWGAFLRAIAIELARIEYMYAYDVAAKNPLYLTPSDIKRQYSDPMNVTGSFQQISQFDSGDFGDSFQGWVGNTGVILNTVVFDSNDNLQMATTAGQTGDKEPSWLLTKGATTSDGSVVWLNCGSMPTPLAYPLGYKNMLVDLLSAYQEGATPKSIQDVIYAYTGKNIVVEELYKQIVPGGFYDQSDRNSVTVSVNVGGNDPLTDVESLAELQQITNSLYGAVDLAKPAHVGLEFTTVFGSDENVDCFISPRYLTQTQLLTITEQQQSYYSLIAYVLSQPIVGWVPLTTLPAGTVTQDSNGNIQLATTSGVTGAAVPTWNPTLQGTTSDGSIVWINIGTIEISISAYAELSTTQQECYQGYYQNLNCVGTGIDDNLSITVQLVEEPPFNPMLYQAPILDPANPTTTLASFGRKMLAPLSSTNWQSLMSSPQVWDGSVTYSRGALVRGRQWGQDGSFNAGVWTPGGWQMYRAKKKSTGQDPLTDINSVYWIPLSSPSIYQGYYQLPNGTYTLGIRTWAPNLSIYTGQFLIDNNGSLQIAAVGTSPQSPPQSPPIPGVTSPIVTVGTSFGAVTIVNNQLTVVVSSTSNMGLVSNASLVTLLGFTYAKFLNGQTLPVISVTSNSITMTFVHDDYSSGTQLEAGATARVGFSQSTTIPTYDGTIVWKYLGSNYLTDPSKWIQVVGNDGNVSGEVANWDISHPMGLVAPRADLCWEIGGGDSFSGYGYE